MQLNLRKWQYVDEIQIVVDLYIYLEKYLIYIIIYNMAMIV